jgi:hypothetical protein
MGGQMDRITQLEANIFIDDILKHLMEEGIIALPKHDSILCPESQADAVEEIMTARLDERLGAGRYFLRKKTLNLKINDYAIRHNEL